MVSKAYERWTNDDTHQLILMLTIHADLQDIADILQRTEGAIRRRIELLYNQGTIRIIDWRIQNGGDEGA